MLRRSRAPRSTAPGLPADDRGHGGLPRAPQVVILGQPRLPGPAPLAGPAVAARADGHDEAVTGVPGAVQAAVGAPGPVVLGGPGLPGPVAAARAGAATRRPGHRDHAAFHGIPGTGLAARREPAGIPGLAGQAARGRHAGHRAGRLTWHGPGGYRVLAGQATEAATARDAGAAGHRALAGRNARATGDGALAGRNAVAAGRRALTRRDRAAAGRRALAGRNAVATGSAAAGSTAARRRWHDATGRAARHGTAGCSAARARPAGT